MRFSRMLRNFLLAYAVLYVAGAGIFLLFLSGRLRPLLDQASVEPESVGQVISLLRTTGLAFAIVMGVLSGAIIVVLVRREMKPLQSFAAAARNIAAGQEAKLSVASRNGRSWKSLAEALTMMQSELARREQTFAENSLRLEAVLGSMIEGVLAIDQKGLVVLANQAACDMLDLTQSELVGQRISDVVRIPAFRQAIERVIAGVSHTRTEFQTLGSSRRKLSVRVTSLSEQAQLGAAVVLHDVTELRNLETMRQDFVANVSHELKTPLSAIKAYAETLRLGAINDHLNNLGFVQQIEEQAELLNRQIRDLLQLARVETGRAVFDLVEVDVGRVFLECIARFGAEAKQRQIHLQIASTAEPVLALADREALQTILDNLVSNGIRYAKPGGRVEISAEHAGDQVEIRVVDDGIGIAPEDQRRIFERFYRVDKGRSRDVGGTGLGLAIVKHTTQALGGSIQLESRIGRGSRFTVKLPLARGKIQMGATVDATPG